MRVRIKDPRGFGWLLCFINLFIFFLYKMGFFFRQYSGIASLALLAVYVTKINLC